MHLVTLPAAFAALASIAGALWMQQDPPKRFAFPWPESQEAGMKRWMDTCKPGPAHERLKELLGSYVVTTRMWMGGSDSPPSESKGSAEITWFVEGRWIQIHWSGEFMGMLNKGLTILGYDNFKQRFVQTTVDAVQTCMNSASGLFDQKGDHLILWGTIDEPMTPEQDKQVKYVYRNFGQDKWTLEIHDMMIGESNTRVFEVEYARKKK